MNQQQKNYTISRIATIAISYVSSLQESNVADLKEYRNHNRVTIQDLLFNDRELLLTLPIKEGVDLDANAAHRLEYLFDFSDITKDKIASNPFPKPDYSNEYDHSVKLTVIKEKYKFNFNYADLLKRAKVCAADYQKAVDQIMIGSDADALAALENFAAVFGD